MDDLLAFVRAQLDADEQLATAAQEYGAGRWKIDLHMGPHRRVQEALKDERGIVLAQFWGETLSVHTAGHIARHDPAAVLVSVKADRAILAQFDQIRAYHDRHPYEAQAGAMVGALRSVIKQRAQVFAGRPGWREEWAA